MRTEGLFFLQFRDHFGVTAQVAAWPGSLMATLNLFMGWYNILLLLVSSLIDPSHTFLRSLFAI